MQPVGIGGPRARYERESAEVDRYSNTSFWDRRYHQRRLATVTGLLRPMLRGSSSFLDVGCGSGEYLLAADDAGIDDLVGVDLSFGYCRRARRLAPRGAVCVGAMGSLPFRDHSVDVILCSEVVEHVEPAEAASAVNELLRVGRRAVVITTPNSAALIRRLGRTVAPARVDRLDAQVGHINLLDVPRVREMLSASGWRVTRLATVHVLPPVIGELVRLPPKAERLVGRLERAADRFLPASGNCIISAASRQP